MQTIRKDPLRALRYAALLLSGQGPRGDFSRRFMRRLFRRAGIYKALDFVLGLFLGRWDMAIRMLACREGLKGWPSARSVPRILLLGMGSVGDVLQITPALRVFREKFPAAKICLLHRSPAAATVLRGNPNVDLVATADFHQFDLIREAVKQDGAADLVVDIRSIDFLLAYTPAPPHLRSPAFSAVMPQEFFDTAEAAFRNWVRPHAVRPADGRYEWPKEFRGITYLDVMGRLGNLPIHSRSALDFHIGNEANAILKAIPQDKPFITVQSGVDADVVGWAKVTGQRPTKLLPMETWRDAVARLSALNFAIIQLGTNDDLPIPGVTLDMRGKTSLEEAAAIIRRAYCHLGTEGGLVHLARAVGTKSVVCFGPTAAAFLGYPQNINLTASDCTGCWGSTVDWYIYCPRGFAEPPCMNAFTAQMIVDAVGGIGASDQTGASAV